jgi:hypothetical protein
VDVGQGNFVLGFGRRRRFCAQNLLLPAVEFPPLQKRKDGAPTGMVVRAEVKARATRRAQITDMIRKDLLALTDAYNRGEAFPVSYLATAFRTTVLRSSPAIIR